MSRSNSRNYAIGAADALEDNELEQQHDGEPLGPRPNDPNYPRMYMYGYEEHRVYSPHKCDHSCDSMGVTARQWRR